MELEFYNPLESEAKAIVATPGDDQNLQDVIDNFPVADAAPEPTTTEDEVIETPLKPDVDSTEDSTEEESDEPQVFEETVTGMANYFSEQGLIKDVPADMDLEAFDKESFVKLIQHNQEVEGKSKFEEGVKFANTKLVGKLDGFTQKIMSYNIDNPNADEKDIQSYVSSLMYSQDITTLTVENNAEKIVREYYKSIDWEQDAVDNKIIQLTELNALKSEATSLKPKLDVKASAIAKGKLDEVQAIKDFETGLQSQLEARVTNTLDQGTLNDIPLSQDQARFLYAATMNNDTIVTIKGKKVEMGFAEALIRNAKYSPESDMEDLMLGLLVIQEGKSAIDKFYTKKATTKVAEEFTRSFKFSNSKKKGSNVPVHEELNTGIKF